MCHQLASGTAWAAWTAWPAPWTCMTPTGVSGWVLQLQQAAEGGATTGVAPSVTNLASSSDTLVCAFCISSWTRCTAQNPFSSSPRLLSAHLHTHSLGVWMLLSAVVRHLTSTRQLKCNCREQHKRRTWGPQPWPALQQRCQASRQHLPPWGSHPRCQTWMQLRWMPACR